MLLWICITQTVSSYVPSRHLTLKYHQPPPVSWTVWFLSCVNTKHPLLTTLPSYSHWNPNMLLLPCYKRIFPLVTFHSHKTTPTSRVIESTKHRTDTFPDAGNVLLECLKVLSVLEATVRISLPPRTCTQDWRSKGVCQRCRLWFYGEVCGELCAGKGWERIIENYIKKQTTPILGQKLGGLS